GMVARAVHVQGPNRDHPFVKIACSALPAKELEVLFRGDIPPGSTVYLENIHELQPELQRRLGEHIRAPEADGAPRSDVRFIGAAPPRVLDLAERNQIRGELVDALDVVRIDLPPLRQ